MSARNVLEITEPRVLGLPESVCAAAAAYRAKTEAFLRGDLAAEAFRAEHVLMGIYEQRTPGLYMMRVRIGAGRVLPRQLRRIAALSKAYGNGIVHVTTRQDLQIHGVAIENTPHIVEALLFEGLSTRGSGGNTVRNVTACPRSGICPNERFDVSPYAMAVAEFFLSRASSFTLPRKFKVAFSGCPNDCALASVADVGFFAETRDGRDGFRVYAGGGLGANPRGGIQIAEFVPAGDCIEVAEAVRRVFEKYGDRSNRNRARLRYVLNRLGDDEFAIAIGQEAARIKTEGLKRPEIPVDNEPAANEPISPAGLAKNPFVLPEKRPGLYSIELRLPLGDISADDLVKLSHRAEAYGGGLVRTSQLQDLSITGVPAGEVPPALASLKALSVDLTRPRGPKTVACAGASTCRLGLCRSPDMAAAIAAAFEREAAPIVVRASRLHSPIRISGCPNSCAAHQIGWIGLEGRAQRVEGRLMPCYAVYCGGRPSSDGARLGERLGVVPAKRVPELLAHVYREALTDPESLAAVVRAFEQLPPQIPADWFMDFGSAEPFSAAGRSRHSGDVNEGAGIKDTGSA